jgi:hypothetical protein
MDTSISHLDAPAAPKPTSIVTAIVPGGREGPPFRYFAYSTARVSRMTVTLIWPG